MIKPEPKLRCQAAEAQSCWLPSMFLLLSFVVWFRELI